MGTRNLTCVQKDNEIKVAKYCQWDGYPEGQGKVVVEFIKNKFDKELFLKKIQLVKKLTQEEEDKNWQSIGVNISKNDGFVTMEESNAFKEKFPHLHRDMGGAILEFIQNITETTSINYSKDFALNGLFCEWIWVLNLDSDTLDVYKGFQSGPCTNIFCDSLETSEAHKSESGKYYPVKQFFSIPIKDIKRLAVKTVINRIKKLDKELQPDE